MSGAGETPVVGLAVRTPALEPAWVRHGSANVKKEYAAALQFEEMLVTQLASSMSKSTEAEGSGEEGAGTSEPGASVYSSMLPQALASGVVSGGGLGLAAELTRQLAGRAAGGEAPAPGGTRAA